MCKATTSHACKRELSGCRKDANVFAWPIVSIWHYIITMRESSFKPNSYSISLKGENNPCLPLSIIFAFSSYLSLLSRNHFDFYVKINQKGGILLLTWECSLVHSLQNSVFFIRRENSIHSVYIYIYVYLNLISLSTPL